MDQFLRDERKEDIFLKAEIILTTMFIPFELNVYLWFLVQHLKPIQTDISVYDAFKEIFEFSDPQITCA